jgi:hypothetical protein
MEGVSKEESLRELEEILAEAKAVLERWAEHEGQAERKWVERLGEQWRGKMARWRREAGVGDEN